MLFRDTDASPVDASHNGIVGVQRRIAENLLALRHAREATHDRYLKWRGTWQQLVDTMAQRAPLTSGDPSVEPVEDDRPMLSLLDHG
jgi:hypothetical protein